LELQYDSSLERYNPKTTHVTPMQIKGGDVTLKKNSSKKKFGNKYLIHQENKCNILDSNLIF